MNRQRKKRTSQSQLTSSELAKAAQRMMMGAQAHQRASVYCLDKPDAKPPNIDAFYFMNVSFELVLFSIEHSLRLLMLLHYSIRRPKHNIFQLFNEMTRRSSQGRSSQGGALRSELFSLVNFIAASQRLTEVSEEEIHDCLQKHDSSYVSLRYIGLDKDARPSLKFEAKPYEVKIMHCFALALIDVNLNKMKEQGINFSDTVRKIPMSEMTNEEKKLLERLQEESVR